MQNHFSECKVHPESRLHGWPFHASREFQLSRLRRRCDLRSSHLPPICGFQRCTARKFVPPFIAASRLERSCGGDPFRIRESRTTAEGPIFQHQLRKNYTDGNQSGGSDLRKSEMATERLARRRKKVGRLRRNSERKTRSAKTRATL